MLEGDNRKIETDEQNPHNAKRQRNRREDEATGEGATSGRRRIGHIAAATAGTAGGALAAGAADEFGLSNQDAVEETEGDTEIDGQTRPGDETPALDFLDGDRDVQEVADSSAGDLHPLNFFEEDSYREQGTEEAPETPVEDIQADDVTHLPTSLVEEDAALEPLIDADALPPTFEDAAEDPTLEDDDDGIP